MFRAKVKFGRSRKRGKARRFHLAAKAGQMLAKMIHDRMTTTLRDGDGVPRSKLTKDYALAKSQHGARPIRDGVLTGAMWKALTVMVYVGKHGDEIKLYFAGSSVVSEKRIPRRSKAGEILKTKKGKVRMRTVRRRVKNATKAGVSQANGWGRYSAILSMTQAEIDLVAGWVRDQFDPQFHRPSELPSRRVGARQ